MGQWQLPAELLAWASALSGPLHGRLAWRFLPLLRGLLFAQGRRTVAGWLRAAGLGADFRRYYYFLGSLGPRAGALRFVGEPLWVVADVAYANRPCLRAERAGGGVVVRRLRKDAALWGVPGPPRRGAPKRRGARHTEETRRQMSETHRRRGTLV